MERLKLLMDYTKFHLGAYLTLGAIAVGLLRAELVQLEEIGPSLLFLALAGACGGVIGSSIPEYETFDAYAEADLGPSWCNLRRPYRVWAGAEHAFFWVAIMYAAVVLTLG